MGQGGRITCPRCGANNFDTVTACWKCSAPLAAGSPGPAASVSAPTRPASAGYSPISAQPVPSGAPVGQVVFADRAAAAPLVATGNPAAANRAAFWLGMLFPYFGLPIGLAFIMCDDRRRQEVGRLCVWWSLLSGAIHILLMILTVIGMRQYFAAIFGAVQGGLSNRMGGGMGGGMEGGF